MPLFPEREGRGVRIAVIDSGVNPRHPHIRGPVGGGENMDLLGHGTAVMAAIQEKAPAAEYFAVKVFERELRTTSNALLTAIEWCVENRMDVVNLSLGTPNSGRAEEFRTLAGRGPLLVSAATCYPGCLEEVIGVEVDSTLDREAYRIEDKLYYASGYPRPVPGVPPERNLQGISFAVANMTGFIARAMEGLVPHQRHKAEVHMELLMAVKE